MSTSFNSGDKVVCIDDSRGRSSGQALPIKKGGIYCVEYSKILPEGPAVWLVGIDLGKTRTAEYCFAAERFRLVSEVKAILAIYKKESAGSEVSTP